MLEIAEIKRFRKGAMVIQECAIWSRRSRRRVERDEGKKRGGRRQPSMSQISGRKDVFLLGLPVRVERNEKTGFRGRSGEMAGPRSPFHQMPSFTRVDFGRGARTTGRGSVNRTKRSQAFSIQSLGQNPWANCTSKRRIIRHTTYLS